MTGRFLLAADAEDNGYSIFGSTKNNYYSTNLVKFWDTKTHGADGTQRSFIPPPTYFRVGAK